MEDGLDIGLVEFLRLELIAQFLQSLCNICSPPHNTIPLTRLQRHQILVVFPIIQYRSALCKAGGGDFPGFVKPTAFGPSFLILNRDGAPRRLQGEGLCGILTLLRESCGTARPSGAAGEEALWV